MQTMLGLKNVALTRVCRIVIGSKYRNYSYEGDGKTKASIMNRETDKLMINTFSQIGFRLNNEVTVLGPMLLFPRSVLSWNIQGASTVTEETLSLLTILEPKIDLLVIGYGDAENGSNELKKNMIQFGRKHNISVELQPTDKACATYNFLIGENRYVAAAVIPPQSIKHREDDILATKHLRDEIFNMKDPVF